MSKVSCEAAQEVLGKWYGVMPKRVKKMNCYQHANFKTTLPAPECDGSRCTKDYIMKFVDTTHFSYCGNTELQHAMLKHFHVHGISASFPVSTVKGGSIVEYTHVKGGSIVEYIHGEKGYTVQLLSFIKGVSINEAEFTKNDVTKISHDVGQLLGAIHDSLMTLEWNTATASSVYSPYHIQNALVFKEKVDYVKDNHVRELIENWFLVFANNFLPLLGDLRKGFIHGDFSDTNVIVGKEENGWEIKGVIDFEECCYGYLVGDVAICIAYIMLKAASSGSDPLEASVLALQAYEAQIPLTPVERRVLLGAVASRMAVSYASASYEAHFSPDNHDFLFSQAKSVPIVLRMLEGLGRQKIEETWFGER